MNNPADTLAALAESRSELVRKHEAAGCPLARELGVLRAMCSCRNDETSVDEAEARYLHLVASLKGEAAKPKFTTGHCENHRKPGGCHLHNLQCGYPECDRRPVEPTPSPAPQGGGEAWPCKYHKGADCDRCGGTGWKKKCNRGECQEFGCSGYGDCIATPPAQQPGEVELAAMRIAVVSGDGPVSDSDKDWWFHLGKDVRAKYVEMATAALAPKEKGNG